MSEPKPKSKAILEMEKRIRENAAKYHEFLNNPVGKSLIEILQGSFEPDDLRGATVEETYFNLGRRDVIKFLQSLQRIYERDQNNAT